MAFVASTALVECGLKKPSGRVSVIRRRCNSVRPPALDAVARSPLPAVCFDAEESARGRDRRASLCASAKDYHAIGVAIVYFIAVRVDLRVIGKRPANAPDAQIAGRIIIHRRRRVSDATEYKWTTYAAANVPGGDKIFWRDGRA